jgi:nucleoside-diphosphate-sugar epimerase
MGENGSGDARAPAEVVVTGASGWLGQNLVRALVRDPDRRRVRCLVHDAADAVLLEVVDPKVETVVGDVRDPVAADRLFDGIGTATVFHAAAIIHPLRRTRDLFDVNVGGTQLVLDRARRAGVRRFVHVSSNSPFGANRDAAGRFDENSPYSPYLSYGESKAEAEQLVQRSHDRGDLGPGTQRRSMVFTGNLVHGLLRSEVAPAAPGRAYWIADAEPVELLEILSTVRSALAAEGLQVSDRQPLIPQAAGSLAETADRVLQSRGLYVQAVHVLGELKDTIACDISRARRELGYEPTTSLFDGMRASVRWCIERGEPL